MQQDLRKQVSPARGRATHRRLPHLAALFLMSCVRNLQPQALIPEEEDRAITFPDFDARARVKVGDQRQPYELDGVMLRAVTIAANDYIPRGFKSRSCWDRQEAQSYRVIRQGEIIFVSIEANVSACKLDALLLDNGMRYAISADGRILRRLATGEPDGSPQTRPSDAGVQEYPGELVPDSLVGSTLLGDPGLTPPPPALDGGASLDGGSSPGPAR
jgi:hypothetical protein